MKLLFFLIWVMGCPILGDSKGPELVPVTLQLKWKHQFQFAGYYIAKEKGFYSKNGLQVQIEEALPGVDPIKEVVRGKAEFGVGTSELILHRHRGEPVIVLGVILQHSPLSLVALNQSGINHIHKLVGKRLMIEPSSAELFAYLLQEGFTKDAFLLQHHSFDFEDLFTGKTDAISVYTTDELYHLEQRNIPFIQFHPGMGGIDFYGDNLFTTEKFLKENPLIVENFRESSLEGWRYAMQNPEETIQIIYNQYSKRHTIEHLRYEARMMEKIMQTDLIDPGYMHEGRWQHISKTYQKLGLLPESFNVTKMLFFPKPHRDIEKLKSKFFYSILGLGIVSLIAILFYKFYRKAKINEERFMVMFENAPVCMILLDNENTIIRWNEEAEKMFQWKKEEMIGKDVMMIVPLEHQPLVLNILREVHEKYTVSHHQNWNSRKDGNLILCEWLNAPFRGRTDKSNFIICMARDITEKKRLEEDLEKAAHYDSLTGLPNRALILDQLHKAMLQAEKNQNSLAIFFVDLNKFKQVNDTLGHEAGDILLKTVARRLQEGIRQSDHVGRLAGDEFLVILQNIDNYESVQFVANKLSNIIELPIDLKGTSLSITASIGVSLFPQDAKEINSLIHSADERMYLSKRKSN